MTNRRNIIRTAALLGVATPAFVTAAIAYAGRQQELETKYLDFAGPENDPEFGVQNGGAVGPDGSVVGPLPSAHADIPDAFLLLYKTPRDPDPLIAAQYFRDLTQKGSTGEPFNAEWNSKIANPLITGLFSATHTKPSEGDQTSWCAAFVNFCLMAADRPMTFSALSGSFRKYGSPRPDGKGKKGDIAVFRKSDADGDKGFGHVGFFIEETETTVTVLGGNQRGDGNSGQVIQKKLLKNGGGLAYLGPRRIS